MLLKLAIANATLEKEYHFYQRKSPILSEFIQYKIWKANGHVVYSTTKSST